MTVNKNEGIRELTMEELVNEISESETSYQKLKFDHAVTGLENPMTIRYARRGLARLKTELRNRELAQCSSEDLSNRDRIRRRRRKK